MNFQKFVRNFVVYCLLFSATVWSQQQPHLLRSEDVSQVMQQIFDQHVDQKSMSTKVIKSAIKVYIDQFDPMRIYLLQSEVEPYLNMNDAQLAVIMDQYKKNDFSSFAKLNTLFQNAILRSRELRTEIEKSKSALFDDKGPLYHEDLFSEKKLPFAKNTQELKDRTKNDLLQFIRAERRRFGESQVEKNEAKIIGAFETNLRSSEDHYLAVDDQGKPLPADQKENFFVFHIIKALASSLDAHTTFYNAEEAYDLRVRLEKEFQGIGVVLQQTPEGVAVNRLIDGGPAAKSGLIKVNDKLIEIDGKAVKEEPIDKITDMIRGENGTAVTLVLARKEGAEGKNGEKQYHVKLTREPITLNDDRVDVSYDTFANGVIGKVTLHAFYQGDGISSEKDLKDAIKKLDQKGNLRGLILDLRDNSGGFLSQAVKVAGLFISNGVVVISKYSNGDEKIYRDVDGKMIFSGPLVILTSKATASAAEIVAQALQDYGVAIIVGDEHTYGKGTIQSQTVTSPQGSSYFKVTVGKYYTVSGNTPQIQGVKADIVIPGPYSKEKIGEEYLDHSLKPDKIAPEYNDELKDIDPTLKSWYMHYYVPTLQKKLTLWKDMVPALKKNTEYRLAHNKNYQTFLKVLNGEQAEEEPGDEELKSGEKKNFGAEDLQMAEAVNIIKDMIYLQAHSSQTHTLDGSSAHLEAFKESAK